MHINTETERTILDRTTDETKFHIKTISFSLVPVGEIVNTTIQALFLIEGLAVIVNVVNTNRCTQEELVTDVEREVDVCLDIATKSSTLVVGFLSANTVIGNHCHFPFITFLQIIRVRFIKKFTAQEILILIEIGFIQQSTTTIP